MTPPYQSKLIPHEDLIRECRAKRWTYTRIAGALLEKHSLKTAASTIFNFVKVRARKRHAYALPLKRKPITTRPADSSNPRLNPNLKMNLQDLNINSTSDINHRLLVPIQTRGGLGKSTVAITLCEWLQQRDVTWKGYDLDSFNQTLSTVYPAEITALEVGPEPEGDIVKILRKVTQQDVTLIDPSAHMNRTILSAFERINFTSFAANAQVRTTVMIYPMDEVSDMNDISQTVDALGDRVDWIIVRNPARISTTRFFEGSELETQLIGYKAASLDIPPLLTDTRNHLRAHEVKLGRGLSPAEALKNLSLRIDVVHRTILERWIGDLFERFDRIASHLVPTAAADKIKPPPKTTHRRSLRKEAAINLENIL